MMPVVVVFAKNNNPRHMPTRDKITTSQNR